MINQALELLGPDLDLLTDILLALGQKHVVYGVQPEVSVPADRNAINCNFKKGKACYLPCSVVSFLFFSTILVWDEH
jgi:hypothetical protein